MNLVRDYFIFLLLCIEKYGELFHTYIYLSFAYLQKYVWIHLFSRLFVHRNGIRRIYESTEKSGRYLNKSLKFIHICIKAPFRVKMLFVFDSLYLYGNGSKYKWMCLCIQSETKSVRQIKMIYVRIFHFPFWAGKKTSKSIIV